MDSAIAKCIDSNTKWFIIHLPDGDKDRINLHHVKLISHKRDKISFHFGGGEARWYTIESIEQVEPEQPLTKKRKTSEK